MKDQIIPLLDQAINKLQEAGSLPAELSFQIKLDRTRDKSHGDFASNLAMMLAKPAQKNPRDLAALISNLHKKIHVTWPR